MIENVEKQGYLLEDFRLFHLKGAGGIQTEYHYHEFCKLLMLVSGSGSYWIEGQRYTLQPGDVVLVGNGCVHRPEFAPGVPYERIIVYISPDFLRRQSGGDCDLLECFSGRLGHVLRPGKGGAQLYSLADSMEKELAGENFGREVLSSGILVQLLVQLYRSLDQEAALQPGPILPQNERIRSLMAYIDAHLTEDLTIDALAEQFYLSKFHMMRLFRACTGTSINHYITRQRLLLARDMISRGVPATQSCFRSGFGSYSSFTRTYAKYFGTTPTGRKYTARLLEESYE